MEILDIYVYRRKTLKGQILLKWVFRTGIKFPVTATHVDSNTAPHMDSESDLPQTTVLPWQ